MAAETVPRGGELRRGDSSWRLPVPLRRVLLLVPPLALAGLEILHPQPDETVQALMDASTWFAGFHGIQLALTGLVALSVLLLADSFGRADAWVTRLGVGVFLVFFSAYDAAAGIGTGLAMRNARDLSPAQQEGVFDVVKDWPAVGPPFALSIVGTLGWVAAVGALALAARRQGAPRREWIFIGLAAVFLLGGHPFPQGTLAFGCFFIGALLHELPAARPRQSRPITARNQEAAMNTRFMLRTTILGCLAFAATALVSGAETRAEARSTTRAADLTLAKCSALPEIPEARCGSIRVPLDRANPGLGTTRIAFALVPRRDRSRPALATIVHSGGPAIAFGAPYVQAFEPLRGRRDVLLVDQRGSGRSGAIACPALQDVSLALSPRRQLITAIGACGRQLGQRAGAYGTAAAADDIEAVRVVLGIDRLDLWASSYGTYLMTVYAARHPGHVRSLVLNGAYPISFDPWARDRLAAARRAIGLVCARTHACHGDAVLRDVARLATQLRRRPVSFTVSAGARRIRLRLDEAALAKLVYAGNDSAAYGQIPAAVASALDGDLAPLRRLVESSASPFEASGASETQGFALACHDYPRVYSYLDATAARRAAYLRARGAIDPGVFAPFSPAAWTATQLESVDTCLQWPNDATAEAPFPPGTSLPSVPVLVLSGDLDTNTPSSAGRQAADQYPNASFVEIPNVGHTPESSACAVALGLKFIATLKVNSRACAGTGTPPLVAPRAARMVAELPLVHSEGTVDQRRALALVVATAADLEEQFPIIAAWNAASALRGGRYVAVKSGGIRLAGVRVVRDASISGLLLRAEGSVAGAVRVTGAGGLAGRLSVRLAATGQGRATGTLNGLPVDVTFRF